MKDILITDLRSLVTGLGEAGGLMSPSVYDTAQALRFYPPSEGVEPALEWLLAQQQTDGGWGTIPSVPHTRDVPTLAAVLALHTYRECKDTCEAVEAGLAFLHRQGQHWKGKLPECLPTSMELVLPRMLDEAKSLGLDVPREPYRLLLLMRAYRWPRLVKIQYEPGTLFHYSWEAWGKKAYPNLPNEISGVGHSPAATAFWLHLADQAGEDVGLEGARASAKLYLAQAARVTGVDVPGVLPVLWPIDRFEQALALHTILLTGLIEHSALQDVLQPQIQTLASALGPEGLGLSDFLPPDSDDTAAAIAVLKSAKLGESIDLSSLRRFQKDNHILSYAGEDEFATAQAMRAVHAMSFFEDVDVSPFQNEIARWQLPGGLWHGDKWNVSWAYVTCLATFALHLLPGRYTGALQSSLRTLQARQNPDGGWGIAGPSAVSDTSYAALALHTLRSLEGANHEARQKARRWLSEHYIPSVFHADNRWLGKQEYTPYRIDKAFELSAMLALCEE